MADADPPIRSAPAREVFGAFLKLGLTAFGGPVAHLGYFRREFVERRGWLSDEAFAELLAICHFLPGPASSQLGMAIGLRRAGLPGMFAAFLGFTLPAGVLMIAFGLQASSLIARFGTAWLHGLKIAAAAVILQAVLQMAPRLASGPVRGGLAVGAFGGLLIAQGPVAQIATILAGGAFGAALLRAEAPSVSASLDLRDDRGWGPLAVFALLLFLLPVAASLLQNPGLGLASVFYRVGALTFGGGHVVLPLLEAEVVERGWIDAEAFLAGYGAAQAAPGPLFSFAGFVGAAQTFGPSGMVGGLIALFGIFLPSLLLVPGVLPIWDRLKGQPWTAGAIAGVGAVVVGLLAATLWDPVLSQTILRPSDWALLAAAVIFLQVARAPPWLVVLGFAAATGLFLDGRI